MMGPSRQTLRGTVFREKTSMYILIRVQKGESLPFKAREHLGLLWVSRVMGSFPNMESSLVWLKCQEKQRQALGRTIN